MINKMFDGEESLLAAANPCYCGCYCVPGGEPASSDYTDDHDAEVKDAN